MEQGKIRRAKKKVSVSLFKEKGCYRKTASQRTQTEILSDHHKKWLLDSHKYLITERAASKDGKDALAGALAEWITEYPLQLLLTLSRLDIRFLRKVADAEEGEELSVTEKNIDSYICLLVWGLLDVNIVYQEAEVFLGFSVPESVKEKILPKFENLTRDSMEHSDIWCYLASDGEKDPDLKIFWDRKEELGDPVEIQEQLAKFVFMSEKSDYAGLKAAEKTLPAACEMNEQVRLLLVVNRLVSYRRIQDSGKQSEVSGEVREMVMSFCAECRDSETTSALLNIAGECGVIHTRDNNFWQEEKEDAYDFWDEEWEEPAEPVVKTEKIYPNDPCPCGSGKKFKKCCKGKGIYD